jgi:hypothetical protein
MMVDTAHAEGEPSGVAVFTPNINDYKLNGVYHNMGWNSKDLLSPIIAAKRPLLIGKREEQTLSMILAPEDEELLEEEWRSPPSFDLYNFSVTAAAETVG